MLIVLFATFCAHLLEIVVWGAALLVAWSASFTYLSMQRFWSAGKAGHKS